MRSVSTEKFRWAWSGFVNREFQELKGEILWIPLYQEKCTGMFGWHFKSKLDQRVEQVSEVNKNWSFLHWNVPQRKYVNDKPLPNKGFQWATILDKMDEKLRPPLPPFQWWKKWCVFVVAREHHWIGGRGTSISHFILSKIVRGPHWRYQKLCILFRS